MATYVKELGSRFDIALDSDGCIDEVDKDEGYDLIREAIEALGA